MKVKELFSNLWAPGGRQVILYFPTYPGEEEVYRGPISKKFLKDYGEAEVRAWFPGLLGGICVETKRPWEEEDDELGQS